MELRIKRFEYSSLFFISWDGTEFIGDFASMQNRGKALLNYSSFDSLSNSIQFNFQLLKISSISHWSPLITISFSNCIAFCIDKVKFSFGWIGSVWTNKSIKRAWYNCALMFSRGNWGKIANMQISCGQMRHNSF